MPMNHAEKEAQVASLKEAFDNAVATVLLDYRGVTVETITELRARFREAGIDYRVVKNNLVKKAIAGTELENAESFLSQLTGMTGIAWSYEEPSSAAKVIKKFRDENKDVLKKKDQPEKLVPKCAVLDGQVMSGNEVETTLASMPGKDEVRAQLLATLMAPAQHLVAQLAAPATRFALVLDAKKRKEEGA